MTPQLHGCALFPPPEHAAPLAALRARFDPVHALRTVPHITLKQGFEGPAFDSAEERALVDGVWAATRAFGAIPIALDRVESFCSPQFGGVVYARVVADRALWALSAAIVDAVAALGYVTCGCSPEHENAGFFPHLTLAQGLTPAAVEAMLSALHAWEPVRFDARIVGVGRCDGHGVWQTPFKCHLREAAPAAAHETAL